jgi:hypothetical protein
MATHEAGSSNPTAAEDIDRLASPAESGQPEGLETVGADQAEQSGGIEGLMSPLEVFRHSLAASKRYIASLPQEELDVWVATTSSEYNNWSEEI